MWKTFLRTAAYLTLSAAAIIVITRVDATAAKPKTAAPETEAAEPKTPPSTRKSAAPKPTPKSEPKLTTASLEKSAPMPATIAPGADAAKSAATLVMVPDWKGKRLSVVRREARKLGLNVKATDGIGDTIPADEASSYRVRKQLVEAGSEVEPGSDVPVRVRMVAEMAEGY
jgi:hypothetical protein